ncbi:MAG: pyridoxal-phosphate dependent enzyme, partial [Candidatus Marinimicrobia bacterium]|nr:pyridoxal-phosphate dependent enzyme [Candidatus Neomarinimicrobiota bacterium]
MPKLITLQNIKESRERISPYIHNTPVMTSQSLNRESGCSIFFKCENFQRTGSFKIRGAMNRVMQLSDADKKKGVVTSSSGNHGAALSYACNTFKIPLTVIMPENSSLYKVENVKRYGGMVQFCEPNQEARDRDTARFIEEKGAVLIHPFNDENIIAGQGTVTLEFLEAVPKLDVMITPLSGGGLMSGILSAVKQRQKDIKIFGAEPREADDAYRSLKSGSIQSNHSTNTICDGLRAQLGSLTFPIIQKFADGIILCSEEEIVHAMQVIWQRCKIIVEPSSAITLSALTQKKSSFAGKNVGIILSGGNVDL